MQFAEDKSRAQFHIRSYEDGVITINESRYTENLIISPETLITGWQPRRVEEIKEAYLDAILQLQPQILVLGTGSSLVFPHPRQLAPLYEARIGVEVMDTAAACRTYNVLVSEDRAVVGALMVSV